MKEYIVKVKSYIGDTDVSVGTGIVVDKRLVITAEHTIRSENNKVIIDGKEVLARTKKSNQVAAVLELEEDFPYSVAEIFSNDEILDEESNWDISGFITEIQKEHNMKGKGLFHLKDESGITDYLLSNICIGLSGDYSGMSGAPVFCDSRIIGILQSQSNITGKIDLQMSSVDMFYDLIPASSIKSNYFKEVLNKRCIEQAKRQVAKNINSRKYIPNIFVEEIDYKENIRYFADPVLFLKKTINNLKCFHPKFACFDECFNIEMTELISKQLIGIINEVATELEGKSRKDNNNSIRFYLDDFKKRLEYINYKYILITKDAGQGKTNFLCDFTNNFLIKKNYYVLYFNAYEFSDNPIKRICRELTMDSGYDFKYVNKVLHKEWLRTKRPVVIVIDGLNENTIIDNFGICIREFLEICTQHEYVKVIMSTRNEFLQERFSDISDGNYVEKYRHMQIDARSDEFAERIFWGYLSFFKINIRRNTLTDRTYNLLTEDVLLLRFFCEVNENKTDIYMYDIYKYDLFDKYIGKKSEEYFTKEPLKGRNDVWVILNKIVKHMIEEMTFTYITLDIFTEDERKLLSKMLDSEVIFKEEKVVKKGILENEQPVICFTFDEFRDFCITNYLLGNFVSQEKFMAFWNNMSERNLTIKEGVQKYIFYLSKTKYRDQLLHIIEETPEYAQLYWANIWHVEEKYISEADVIKWKAQIQLSGSHCGEIVEYLVLKYDCDYSKKPNIKLLFQILDEVMESIGRYDSFIKAMFSKRRLDKYGYHKEGGIVIPIDTMVEDVLKNKRYDSLKEIYRLMIYLYLLHSNKIEEAWRYLYINSPNNAIVMLKEMNQHRSLLIKSNVRDILIMLMHNPRNDKFDLDIEEVYEGNSFCYDIEDHIWGDDI